MTLIILDENSGNLYLWRNYQLLKPPSPLQCCWCDEQHPKHVLRLHNIDWWERGEQIVAEPSCLPTCLTSSETDCIFRLRIVLKCVFRFRIYGLPVRLKFFDVIEGTVRTKQYIKSTKDDLNKISWFITRQFINYPNRNICMHGTDFISSLRGHDQNLKQHIFKFGRLHKCKV